MSTRDPQKMLVTAEVADLYGVDVKTVTRWAKAGRLITVTTPGAHRRYPAEQFAAAIAQRAQARGARS